MTHDAHHVGPYCHHAHSTRLERHSRINAVHRSAASTKRTMEDHCQARDEESGTPCSRGWSDSLGSRDTLTRTGNASIKRWLAIVASHSTEEHRANRQGKMVLWCIYRAWTNEKIRRHWKLPCAKIEARVRRLRWTHYPSRRP